MTELPPIVRKLCDDAAVFPPGSAPLADAVPAHLAHRASPYRELVGPLVLAAPALDALGPLLDEGCRLEVAVTAPDGPAQIADALATADTLPVEVRAIEVAVPAGTEVTGFFAALDAVPHSAAVYVEVPRDERRPEVIAGCAERGHGAKLRTGGVRADLYPDEAELGTAIMALVAAGVRFKATAGLHHAIRNTDPGTGFEQHGFLNVLLATDAALRGGDVVAALAERDGCAVADAVRALDAGQVSAVRRAFASFGTCSITEPLHDLQDLDLIPASLTPRQGTIL
ncbi:hypothetical protein ACIRQQ_22530 [Streptomyces fuscichromogenes]|uniref:hypothetical protein n=1 Tax=Streptomyces fuscichromogenes TaxID=1324013 RepID=UPI00382A2FA7